MGEEESQKDWEKSLKKRIGVYDKEAPEFHVSTKRIITHRMTSLISPYMHNPM